MLPSRLLKDGERKAYPNDLKRCPSNAALIGTGSSAKATRDRSKDGPYRAPSPASNPVFELTWLVVSPFTLPSP